MHIILVMPVYEDWEAAGMLCAAIDQSLPPSANTISVLLVDDGSNKIRPHTFPGFQSQQIHSMQVLKLRRNLGHQRAIAVALAYLQQELPSDAAIVMDADGEDRPQDIPRLIQAFEASPNPVTVFAERGRRVETLSFRLFYSGYRLMHRILTGRTIRFGNFSLIPRQHIDSMVAYPELWNHYAAAVLKAKLPYTTVRADRGKRLRGNSKMSFVGLVIHGLSALFASYEIVSTRLLVGTALLGLGFFGLLLAVVGIRLFTHLAIPGWATFTGGLLFILVTQSIATLLIIIFSVMMSRNTLGFLPIRDYEYFVADCVLLTYPMSDLTYVGQELDLFSNATHWKRYWSSCVRPFLRGDVLEVGAGLGTNTPLLAPQSVRSWVCLEPDAALAQRAAKALATDPTTAGCKVIAGTTQSLSRDNIYDALLYIDVLEHIEHDKEELARAESLLKPGGSLIVLSPAHNWLFTPFDKAIGHYRRYDKTSLRACTPAACNLRQLWYLDSVGMLASCGNRLLLQQSMPALKQILFWDRFLVPPSTVMDRLLGHTLGKSILAVWSKR